MKNIKQDLDPKYTKIALYAGITLIVSVLAILFLYSSRGVISVGYHLLAAILKPLILGCMLCYLLYPLVTFFEKKLENITGKQGLRGLAVILTLIIIFAAVALLLFVIIATMTKQISNIDYDVIKTFFADTFTDAQDLLDQINDYLGSIGINLSSVGTYVTATVSNVAGGLSTLTFGFIFSVYFLIDGRRISAYWTKVASSLFTNKAIAKFKELAADADQCFSGYIRGQALDALIIGTSVTVLFVLIKMPYAFLIGLIIGIGNLIPFVGPILGYGAVIIINLLQYNPRMLIIGLITMLFVMFIDSNLINPRLLAGTIKVHPLLVVASLLAGGTIGGILGMLISVPTGAFLKLQFEKWLAYRNRIKEDASKH